MASPRGPDSRYHGVARVTRQAMSARPDPGRQPEPAQDSSLAADFLSSALADESLPPDVRSAAARLTLIDRAQKNGATWTVIGATLGISGPEAKKRARGLREKVRRAVAMAGGPEDLSEEDGSASLER